MGLSTLRSRRDLKKLMYWIHILSVPDKRLIKEVYTFSKNSNMKTNYASSKSFNYKFENLPEPRNATEGKYILLMITGT